MANVRETGQGVAGPVDGGPHSPSLWPAPQPFPCSQAVRFGARMRGGKQGSEEETVDTVTHT